MSAESDDLPVDSDAVLYEEQVQPEYGVLGFTLRELLIVGVWLVVFITSFFPLYDGGPSLWGLGIHWILPIALPTVAVFLIVLRRFSPDGIRRVGSLGIDQFASVAFSVAAAIWVQTFWDEAAASIRTDDSLVSWLTVVQLLATLVLVALTVFAPLIPGLQEDFRGRLETLAHRNANPVRPVIARPKQHPVEDTRSGSRSAADEEEAETQTSVLDVELSGVNTTDEIQRLGLASQVPLTSHASNGDTGTTPEDEDDYVPGYARRSGRTDTDALDENAVSRDVTSESATSVDAADAAGPDDATRSNSVLTPPDQTGTEGVAGGTRFVRADEGAQDAPATRASGSEAQPFWILAPTERDVYDDRGEPLFRIGPSAWALVIEDREGAYVVRHDDGRIGYLHDITDIARG